MINVTRTVNLTQHPRHTPPRVRPHRQEVDDVRPTLPVLVAVAHQAGRNRVAVGPVADQDIAEVVASARTECSKEVVKLSVFSQSPRLAPFRR
jgi:hypothetical protein